MLERTIDLGSIKIEVSPALVRLSSTNSMGFTNRFTLEWDEVPLLAVELRRLMESEEPWKCEGGSKEGKGA